MIAIDAMGGDFAPDVVLRGVLNYVKSACVQQQICLFGPEAELRRRLSLIDPSWEELPIQLVDAQEHIDMGEEPVRAVKSKRDSSLVKAVESVAKGYCEAVISAGNSGAVMAASLFLIGRTKGVERPALVGLMPAKERPVVCLDLGANADCKARYLYQFAHLGAKYASDVLGIKDPSVGLLSVGEEPEKGSILTKEAFLLLKKSSLRFIGNVEPCHILQNKADVVVCDGFAGNVLLKTFEAVSSLCCRDVAKENQVLGEKLKKKFKIAEGGGALLLGIRKPSIVLHGSASASCVERAITFVNKIVSKISLETYFGDENMVTRTQKQCSDRE